MSHHCHATACKVEVPPEMFMCKRHWFMLAGWLRKKIWATYRPGQCDDMAPSRAYCEAARESVVYIAEKEHLTPDTELYDFFLRT